MTQNQTIHVFDLDDTLAIPDRAVDQQNKYTTIDHHVPIPEMMELFNQVHNKIILTNRHPDLQSIIEERYRCPVICRDYCLEWSEIIKINESRENLSGFLSEMIDWKTRELNDLSAKHDFVIFYDDMIERYTPGTLNPNIRLQRPLHLVEC